MSSSVDVILKIYIYIYLYIYIYDGLDIYRKRSIEISIGKAPQGFTHAHMSVQY